jgi:hypothetical protein
MFVQSLDIYQHSYDLSQSRVNAAAVEVFFPYHFIIYSSSLIIQNSIQNFLINL